MKDGLEYELQLNLTASSTNAVVQWFINQLFNYLYVTDNKYVVWLIPIEDDHTNCLGRQQFVLATLLEKLSLLLSFVAGYNTMSLNGRHVLGAYSEISYLHSNSIHLFFCCCFVNSHQNFISDLPV